MSLFEYLVGMFEGVVHTASEYNEAGLNIFRNILQNSRKVFKTHFKRRFNCCLFIHYSKVLKDSQCWMDCAQITGLEYLSSIQSGIFNSFFNLVEKGKHRMNDFDASRSLFTLKIKTLNFPSKASQSLLQTSPHRTLVHQNVFRFPPIPWAFWFWHEIETLNMHGRIIIKHNFLII